MTVGHVSSRTGDYTTAYDPASRNDVPLTPGRSRFLQAAATPAGIPATPTGAVLACYATLLERQEPYRHAVGRCERCHTRVEPLIMPQWWVEMKGLAEPAVAAVRDGRVRFTPERFLAWAAAWRGEVVGTHLKAREAYRRVRYRAPAILLMGGEGPGLSPALEAACTRLVKIPMAGRLDSLNLAVATALMLYEIRKESLEI